MKMRRLKTMVAFFMTMVMGCTILPTASVDAMENQYQISGETVTPLVKDGEDISKKVNSALKEANARATEGKCYTVKIPEGTYYISESLKIRSNTVLDATGCTIEAKTGKFNRSF